eukprot:102725_1
MHSKSASEPQQLKQRSMLNVESKEERQDVDIRNDLFHKYSTEELLLTGYIRQIEILLNGKIIPQSINSLCFDFYHLYNMIFLLIEKNENEIYSIDINNDKSSIYNVIHPQFTPNEPWSIFNGGVCCKQNWILPDRITAALSSQFDVNSYNKMFEKMKKWNYVIFKVGGYDAQNDNSTNCCNAIIMNRYKTSNDNIAFNVKLPNFISNIYGNSLLFSRQHGLISIGGRTQSPIAKLSFSGMLDWEKMKSVSNIHIAATMINKDRILIVNGCKLGIYSNQSHPGQVNAVQIFDMKKNRFCYASNSCYSRCSSGIYHDELAHKVYVGGGCFQERIVKYMEYYDVNRNKWYKLPQTSMKHGNTPILWMSNHHKILNIGSMDLDKNCRFNGLNVEVMDLRMGQKGFAIHQSIATQKRYVLNSRILSTQT